MNKRIVDILTPAATPIALESAQRQLEKFELQIDVAAIRDSFPSQIKQIYNEAVSFADKVIFFAALYNEVQREFSYSVRGSPFSTQLRSYVAHVADLIGNLEILIGGVYGQGLETENPDLEVAVQSLNKIHLDWIELGIQELNYLGHKGSWNEDDMKLATHVFSLLNNIQKSVHNTPAGSLWSFYAERLNDASRLILGASALKRIIAEEDSIESARAVSAVFGIATLCDEISVRQLLGCLVISIFEKLQRLAPLEYRDEDSFEYCASEDSLDLSPESGEAHKFDGVGNYYDKQVRGDAAQVTQLVKEWGVVFKSGLQALCGLPPCDERGEQLFDIINSSPMTMPELSEVLDALLCASKEQFHSALKYLAENAHVDGRACVCLLAVADYINRKDVDPQSLPCDPVEMICEVLNEVNQEDLIVIVGQCKMLLNSRPEYFYDKDLTSAIFEKLLARLSDRLKQQEAI